MRFLVTGGSGFLGSHFVKTVLQDERNFVVNIDRLDTCSTKKMSDATKNYIFVRKDINEEGAIAGLILEHDIEMVVAFAAQSHVDSSFTCSRQHVIDNCLGMHSVLEAMRECHPKNGVRLLYISSDEVLGQNHGDEAKTEESLMRPSSPYSATKGCAELLCGAYVESFKIPIVIVRGNNAYGPFQHPEKVVPRFLRLLLDAKPLTIQGDGSQRRSFIHAKDFVSAVLCVMEKGDYHGHVYNIGSSTEVTILELAQTLSDLMSCPLKIDYIQDRNYNDSRYLICAKKLQGLGWEQKIPFLKGMLETVEWYKSEEAKDYWMEPYQLPISKLVPPPPKKEAQQSSSKRHKFTN